MNDDDSSPIAFGSTLGRYRVVERLGSGGMGEVWRAVDTALEREVAIKLLPREALATPERRRRFETEAKAAAGVSHPNLVPVYDVGEASGMPFIVQELVVGETLDARLATRGAVGAEQAAEWGAQAAEGLAVAHEAGILHRDVKPSNLILGRDGRLRVLDFGLAKMLHGPSESDAEPGVTRDGLVVGTAHYMSPEQALGRKVDARSDVFSLGVVLYELAVGKRPFEADSAIDVMHAIAYQPPRPLEPGDPSVAGEYLAVVEKALEKKPEERYQSVREVAVDLRRFLRRTGSTAALRPAAGSSERTISVRPVGSFLGTLSGVPPRRRRRLAWSGLALLAGAAAVVLVLQRGRGPEIRTPESARALVRTEAREEFPAFAPDGRAFAYAANTRGNDDVYYRLLSGVAPVRLTDSDEDESEPAFSADGSAIFYARGDREAGETSIWSVPTLGGPSRRVLASGEEPAPSPDGRFLAFRRREGDRTSLWVAKPDGAEARKLLDGGSGEIKGPAVSPDGTTIAFLRTEAYPGGLGDVWTIPSAGGEARRLTNDRVDVWGRVAWLPDGRGVVYGAVRSGASNLWLVEAAGGKPRSVTSGTGWSMSPSVSPDGRSLLVQTERWLSDAWQWDLSTKEGRPLTDSGSVWAPSRLPDGRLLYGDWSRQREELDLLLEDRKGSRVYLAEGTNARATSDGKRVYFSTAAGGGKRVLAVVDPDGGPPRRLTDPLGSDDYPDPVPGTDRVVFCRTAGDRPGSSGVVLLDVASGASRTLFEGDAMATRASASHAVFRSCAPTAGCGVYAVPLAGGTARLVVAEGRWPAVSRDGRTVYALTGPKSRPVLIAAPVDGSAAPRTVLPFNATRDPQFWAVFTLDVPEGQVVAVRQRIDDDIALLEGVFR